MHHGDPPPHGRLWISSLRQNPSKRGIPAKPDMPSTPQITQVVDLDRSLRPGDHDGLRNTGGGITGTGGDDEQDASRQAHLAIITYAVGLGTPPTRSKAGRAGGAPRHSKSKLDRSERTTRGIHHGGAGVRNVTP